MQYIPQRPPFVMIGDIIIADEKHTITNFTISPDNIMTENGFFTEGGLVENMAQTAGAGTGYMAIKNGKPMPMGYIAALKNATISALPKINDTIETEVTFGQIVMNFHQVNGRVICAGKEIASCEFKIFVNPDQPAGS
jgi:predicted hotdog family 3-hydroxylacyl-ACP dehydratase